MKSLTTYITIFTLHTIHKNDDMYTNNMLRVGKGTQDIISCNKIKSRCFTENLLKISKATLIT